MESLSNNKTLIRVWNLTIENKMPNINFKQDIQAHSRLINDILVLNEKNFVSLLILIKIITASADGCTKIFDIKTLNVLKSLNFRENADNKNLSMRSLCTSSLNAMPSYLKHIILFLRPTFEPPPPAAIKR